MILLVNEIYNLKLRNKIDSTKKAQRSKSLVKISITSPTF